jgi:hypothetical protein
LPVSLSTSQDCPTAWVMPPDADKTWLRNHHRNAGAVSDPNAPAPPRTPGLRHVNGRRHFHLSVKNKKDEFPAAARLHQVLAGQLKEQAEVLGGVALVREQVLGVT